MGAMGARRAEVQLHLEPEATIAPFAPLAPLAPGPRGTIREFIGDF